MAENTASLLDSLRPKIPSTWNWDGSTDMSLVEISVDSSELSLCRRIKYELQRSIPKIVKIVRVENPYTWFQYQLKKEECCRRNPQTEELELWHNTNPSYVDSIARNNFDWRRSCRAKYGQGVCFSPSETHARRWSTSNGALILAYVLVGKSSFGNYDQKLPDDDCDTTLGYNNNVYVKYTDNEFYPKYVVYYDALKA